MDQASWIQLPAGKAMVIEVVFVECYRGGPEPGNEPRVVYQYWSKDGRLLAEHDTIYQAPDMAGPAEAQRRTGAGRHAA